MESNFAFHSFYSCNVPLQVYNMLHNKMEIQLYVSIRS